MLAAFPGIILPRSLPLLSGGIEMNIEALIVIGGFTLVLGLLLYVPGYFIGKFILKKAPRNSSISARIRPLGLLFYGLLVALLFTVYSMQHIYPDSAVGQLASTRRGRLMIAGGVIVLGLVIETILAGFGIKFVTHGQSASHPERRR